MFTEKFKGELECPYCQEQIENFKSHINEGFENEETSSCSNCDLVLINQKCLTSHMKIAHLNAMKIFSCESCNIDFDSKRYLFIHKELVDNDNDIKKEIDQEIFDVEIKVEPNDNLNSIPDVLERKHKCNQCEKTFKKSSTLNQHKLYLHSDERNFKCDNCSKAFKQKSKLQIHIDHVHRGIRNFRCDKCEKSFKALGALNEHKVCVHGNSRSFKCEKCHSAFKMKNHLKRHYLKVHSEVRKYKCDQCDKSFTNSTSLMAHIKSAHENIRDFKCEICHWAFKFRNHLQSHIKTVHLKIRKYVCDICDKGYKTSFALKIHKSSSHLGIRNFKKSNIHSITKKPKCNHCGKLFLNVEYLDIHSSNIHK